MSLVERHLQRPPPPGLLHGAGDALRLRVRVEQHPAVHVPGRPPHDLNQGAVGAQIPLAVRVQDGHQRHLRQVHPLPKQVDAHQHLHVAHAQAVDQFRPLKGVELRMDVLDLELQLAQVVRQVLGGALRQRQDQRPLSALRHTPQPLHQVVHLSSGRQDLHHRVRDARGPDHLLHHLRGDLHLVVPRRGRNEHGLVHVLLELVPLEGAVVQAGGQAKPVLHQHGLARPVAVEHAPNLGQRDVRLVHEQQKVLREEVDQRARRLSVLSSVQVDRVVLDPGAVPHLPQHLHVVARAHPDALRLQGLVRLVEAPFHPLQLLLDQGEGARDGVRLRDVVLRGEDRGLRRVLHRRPSQGVHLVDPLDLVVEERHADAGLGVGRKYLDGVAPHAELTRLERRVVALVVVLQQALQEGAVLHAVPLLEGKDGVFVVVALAQTVDAGDTRDDQHVPPLDQGLRGRQAQALDAVVDGGVLFDVGVARRDVGLRLVVIVVGDEIVNGVLRKELLELAVELRRQRLVVRQDEGRPVRRGDEVGHRKGLATARDAHQRLKALPGIEASPQGFDGLRLVARRRPLRVQDKVFLYQVKPPPSGLARCPRTSYNRRAGKDTVPPARKWPRGTAVTRFVHPT